MIRKGLIFALLGCALLAAPFAIGALRPALTLQHAHMMFAANAIGDDGMRGRFE